MKYIMIIIIIIVVVNSNKNKNKVSHWFKLNYLFLPGVKVMNYNYANTEIKLK